MSKRLAVTLSDDTHAQIKERAEAVGQSLNAWIIAAIEREAFRQLCQGANQWYANHPEAVAAVTEDYNRRQEWHGKTKENRGSSAA